MKSLKLFLMFFASINGYGSVWADRSFEYFKISGSGVIRAGAGYSSDTQQMATNRCYNTSVVETGQEGVIKLNTAMTFDELQHEIRFNVNLGGKFGMFFGSAEADYLRSIEDKDYSFSLNYYELLYDTVGLNIEGFGEAILNQQGKKIYKEAYPFFGILCGDEYLSAYQQGAMLVLGININFSNFIEKETFLASVEGGFGNLLNASTSIEQVAAQYNLHGSVSIQAFQRGGDPAQLAKILSKDSDGEYYVLSCEIQSMSDCKKAAGGLLDYAKNNFSTQIDFNTHQGLVPLGNGFATHDPILGYGLIPPKTLITQATLEDRARLAGLLKENQYYQQKLKVLLYDYPVLLDTHFRNQTDQLYKQVYQNIHTLMRPDSPSSGALRCYDYPPLCHFTRQAIETELNFINKNQLEFLDSIQYIYSFCGKPACIYPIGNGHYTIKSVGDILGGVIREIAINQNHYWVNLWIQERYWSGGWYYDAERQDKLTYSGHCWDDVHDFGRVATFLVINPFYFTAYPS